MIKYAFIFLSFLVLVTNPGIAMDTQMQPEEAPKRITHPSTWSFLKEGDPVEVIMPAAGPLSPEHVPAALEFIRKQGLKAFIAEDTLNQKAAPFGYYSHSHKARAVAFIKALLSDFPALWALRGGFGCHEVLDYLEHSDVSALPRKKMFLGFSDFTAIHLWLATQQCPSLHGPVAGLGRELVEITKSQVNKEVSLGDVIKILKGKIPELEHKFDVIHLGKGPSLEAIEGSVLGGNLSIIENHNGTPTALRGRGRFVLLEDTLEDPTRFIRRLLGLLRVGVFDEAKGILFGHMPLRGYEDSTEGTKEIIRSFVTEFLVPRSNIPVLYSPRFGHGPYNDVMPFGTKARLTLEGPTATLRVKVNESAY
ncbi:MAG: LD-carboxypeptidase [Proteobacteria bacterium]|nr:LD-carboxypeptidase [Pseudomonadota bacterium]